MWGLHSTHPTREVCPIRSCRLYGSQAATRSYIMQIRNLSICPEISTVDHEMRIDDLPEAWIALRHNLLHAIFAPLRSREGGGGAFSFVACLSHVTIDHASLSRRSTAVPKTPLTLAAPDAFFPFSIYVRKTFRLPCSPPMLPSVAIYLPGQRSFSRNYLVYQASP